MKISKDTKGYEGKRPGAGKTSLGADWHDVAAVDLQNAVCAAGARGGALRFGYTRDGGAYAIGIYGLGDPYTAYCRPSDDMHAFLSELAAAFMALDTQPKLPGVG